MILCLDLKRRVAEQVGKQAECDCDKKAAVMAAVSGACQIWDELRSVSPEAPKVYQVLSSMLAELDNIGTQVSVPAEAAISTHEPELSSGRTEPEVDVNAMDFGWVRYIFLLQWWRALLTSPCRMLGTPL